MFISDDAHPYLALQGRRAAAQSSQAEARHLVEDVSQIDGRFLEFFRTATYDDSSPEGHKPYPFQTRLATVKELPELIDIPTGLGKTDAVVLAWLWRRRFADEKTRATTPRRLVYCLPMRTLVEQTAGKAKMWLKNLGLFSEEPGNDKLADTSKWKWTGKTDQDKTCIAVTVLMGGESKDEWDLYPEKDAIIIGTQDMLLSRALNRGYGMSRYRWPVHFGLLNNDCLWVMDEVQLMGRGLTTSIQLQAFRCILGTMEPSSVKTIWMSATLEREWLNTVDFSQSAKNLDIFSLSQDDLECTGVKKRWAAVKTLKQASEANGDSKELANEILQKHNAHKTGTRTLVVLNTVKRAVELHSALKRMNPDAHLILIHSRFRPPDRKLLVDDLVKIPDASGTIVVSTQVVEAGVDISAKNLFTELAPWSSLVQRFGRCNRYDEYSEAEVYWIDLPTGKESLALPYSIDELELARNILKEQDRKSVGAASLPNIPLYFAHESVIRKKDLRELFDTTPDLAGHDLDISRFIRETSETDVQVFWRDIPEEGPGEEPDYHRDELCSVPLSDIRDLADKGTKAYAWDSLEGDWLPLGKSTSIIPGMIIMLHAANGRYTLAEGWAPQSKEHVPVVTVGKKKTESYSDDPLSSRDWQTIEEHTDAVFQRMTQILDFLSLAEVWRHQLLEGVRWHDAGKAHPAFQALIKTEASVGSKNYPVGKAPDNAWLKGRLPNKPRLGDARRKHFRHDLASGLLALQNSKTDLVSYLAAAHHGKVRLSIRSMPGEYKPTNGRRFARGVWDRDKMPEIELGGAVKMAATTINLSYMDLGDGLNGQSWLSRMIALLDRPDLGPFRLAYMEALIKAADEKASRGGA
ncbi:MAG: CRISPR-associated helicase Cas3' [Methanothrix sp.]|nr:CRISPR-associated helicase Cas3' [Methanothrix sp.]